jgi:acyl carrier protein
MDAFFEKASEILEIERADGDTVLRDCEAWDSLTALSLVAMIDRNYGVTISADDLIRSNTVGDLYRLVDERRIGG